MAHRNDLIFPQLQAVFDQAGQPVTPSAGYGITGPEIDKLADDEFATERQPGVVFMSFSRFLDTELVLSQNAETIEGEIVLQCFGRGENGDVACVKAVLARLAIGARDADGKFNLPNVGPFTVGGRKFLKWKPANGVFDEFAQPLGNVWAKEQIIEIQMKTD